MKTVNSAQNSTPLVYQAKNRIYHIDQCLPQRKAIDSGKIKFHALTHGHYPGRPIPEEDLPGVSSIGYFDVIEAQDWGIPPHRNEGIEIVFQETGESILTVDGVKYINSSQTLSITRPWQLHSLGDPHMKPGRLHWLIIDVGVRRPNQNWNWPDWCILTPSDRQELIDKLRGNETPVWNASQRTKEIFTELAKLISAPSPENHLSKVRIFINHLLAELLDLLRVEKIVPNSDLISSKRTVELFFRDLEKDNEMIALPWTLDEMAKHCGMKRTTFSAHSKDIFNITPIEILNTARLEHAAQRLTKEPTESITKIALDSGYTTSQYFARSFKKRYNISPRDWRKRHLTLSP